MPAKKNAATTADSTNVEETTAPVATVETPAVETVDDAAKKAQAKKDADEKKAAEKAKKDAEAAKKLEEERKALIASGDLVVTDAGEFTAKVKETLTFTQVKSIMEALKSASPAPVVFADVVKASGQKYPEDVATAMHALEIAGIVKRYEFRANDSESKRGTVSYAWIAE